MDQNRFDTLTRSLTAARSRRGALGGLLVGALGRLASSGTEDAIAKKCKKIRNKQKRKKCRKKAKSPLPPTPVLTYQCPGPAESFVASGVPATARLSQTFTAAQSGSLLEIQFQVIKGIGTTGDYVVQLLAAAADVPTNTVLGQVTIPNASVPAGTAPLTATFAGPPLVAGTQYGAAVSRPGGTDLQFNTRTDNDCAGAAFTQNPNGSGPLFQLAVDDLIVSVTVLA
jgi:hypothetical protein